MSWSVEEVGGGVCAVAGVRAAGIAAGLKKSQKPDLALVAVDRPVAAAGVQTTNQVQAAPVTVTGRHLADGRAQAVLLNSGSANVCTGPDGIALAEEAAATVAAELGAHAQDVLVCSTGVIGVPIPREPYLAGVSKVVADLSTEGHTAAATAIMTTDLVAKEAAVRVTEADAGVVIGGMVKGSGMIAPSMATMLCVLTTDAPFSSDVLQSALRQAVARSFERTSVDGCMSTNDAVLLLSTGTAHEGGGLEAFTDGLTTTCRRLAEQMVADGEGATRTLRIEVTGARSEDEAVAVGRQVGSSALVQTALAGGDPNWGRVMGAVGAGAVPIDPAAIAVGFAAPGSSAIDVARAGMAVAFDHDAVTGIMRGDQVVCRIDLGLGDAAGDFLTCDLTHGYIRINAEYTT